MNVDDPRSIPDVIASACQQYADRPAFTCMGKTLTYRDVDQLSAGFAAWLQQHTQLQPGDRVAVQLPNTLQYPVVLFGVLRAGMVLVNVNPLYTARELDHQLNDCDARLLVVLANLAGTAASIIDDTAIEQVVVTEIGDLHDWPRRPFYNLAVRLRGMVPNVQFRRVTSFRTALALGQGKAGSVPSSVVVNPREAVAVLQYTGGTTGVAKGAMLTHHNLVMNMEQTVEHLGDELRRGSECFLAPLPIYHIYALMLHCLVLFSTGNHSILIPNARDLDSIVKAMRRHRITGFIGLNTLFNSLCHHPGFKALNFADMHICASGGMALKSEVGKLWQAVTGVIINEGYGMTETSPLISFNPVHQIRPGTVGTPVPATEIKVTDEAGISLPCGEPGELWVRGPQVMLGYWERPEATAEAVTADGWLKTGDMAVIQPDGYFQIVDRKKDMILVSGFNVYPNEIEDVVSEHPGVLDAAAIGVPSDRTGEAVKLFVVKKHADLTSEMLVALCRRNLAAYKIPHQIEFVDDLPKSTVGKVLRRELKDREMAKRAAV
jgi:long-chain acyl-CoA synthetase